MKRYTICLVVVGSFQFAAVGNLRAGKCDPVLKHAVVKVFEQSSDVRIDKLYESIFEYEHSEHKSGNTNLGINVSGYFGGSFSQEEYDSLREEFYFWQKLDLTVEVSRKLVIRKPNNEAVRAWLDCIRDQPLSLTAESLGRKDVVVRVEYKPRRSDPAQTKVVNILPVNMTLRGGTSTVLRAGSVLKDGQSVSAIFTRDEADEPAAIIVDFDAPMESQRRFILPRSNKRPITIPGSWTAFVRAVHMAHPANGHLGDPDSRCHLTMSADVELSHDAGRLLARITVIGDEGRHDWSYGKGEKEIVLYHAPPGYRIVSIAKPQQRSDSLHYAEKGAGGSGACEGRDQFQEGQGGATAHGLVAEWDCVGDQDGPELGGATGCRVRLHDIVLIVEKVEN